MTTCDVALTGCVSIRLSIDKVDSSGGPRSEFPCPIMMHCTPCTRVWIYIWYVWNSRERYILLLPLLSSRFFFNHHPAAIYIHIPSQQQPHQHQQQCLLLLPMIRTRKKTSPPHPAPSTSSVPFSYSPTLQFTFSPPSSISSALSNGGRFSPLPNSKNIGFHAFGHFLVPNQEILQLRLCCRCWRGMLRGCVWILVSFFLSFFFCLLLLEKKKGGGKE